MHDVMRFWLRRGVDGFRVDVIWHLLKDEQFRDNPINPNWRPAGRLLSNFYRSIRPICRRFMMLSPRLRRVVDEFDDRVLIGEIYLPFERLVAYYGRDLGGVHLPFNFALLSAPWRARSIARTDRRV